MSGDRREITSTDDQRVINNSTRQTYRVLSAEEKAMVDDIKGKGAEFIALLHRADGTPILHRLHSRDLQLAKDHAEDAVMRAVRHITQ